MSGRRDDKAAKPRLRLPMRAQARLDAMAAVPGDDFVAMVRASGLDPARAFRGKELRGIDFRRCDLTVFDFTGADLRGSLLPAGFTGAPGARLDAEGDSADAPLIETLPQDAAEPSEADASDWSDIAALLAGPGEGAFPGLKTALARRVVELSPYKAPKANGRERLLHWTELSAADLPATVQTVLTRLAATEAVDPLVLIQTAGLPPSYALAEADLRGVDLRDWKLDAISLNGADLRHCRFGRGQRARLRKQGARTRNQEKSVAVAREVARLEGHGDRVLSVAFSPNGARLATGSGDNTARIWDTISRAVIVRIKGHRDSVNSVAFSPDGDRLATGSDDYTARIWDAGSGAMIARFEGRRTRVRSVAFSPGGARLATRISDRTVKIWETGSGAELARLEAHEGAVNSVAFSPDGARLATGSDDNKARIWDTISRAVIARLDGHGSKVTSVAFSPNGARLATGSWDRTARIWDAGTGAEIVRLKGHGLPATSVAFSPDGTRLATGGVDRTARIWDAASGAEIARLEGHESGVWSVAFSPDGARLATGGHDGTARIWYLPLRLGR